MALQPPDRIKRQLRTPTRCVVRVSDVTYAAWQGFVCVARVVDAFARHIVDRRGLPSARADFVLDALEQAPGDDKRFGPLQHSTLLAASASRASAGSDFTPIRFMMEAR